MDSTKMLLERTPEEWQARADNKAKDGINLQFPLTVAVKCPTARANDGNRPPYGDKHHEGLEARVKRQWATPTKQDSNGSVTSGFGRSLSRETFQSECAIKENGQLNPDWVEWLMGWPCPGWTALDPMPELDWRGWDVDPADEGEIPRLARNVPDRVSRLKALGNGQVPACVVLAWEILEPKEQTECTSNQLR